MSPDSGTFSALDDGHAAAIYRAALGIFRGAGLAGGIVHTDCR